MKRDGYISAEFRMGHQGDSPGTVEWVVPNMIWDIHILDKGRQFLAMNSNDNTGGGHTETHAQRLIRLLTLLAGPNAPTETDETWAADDVAALEELLTGEFITALQVVLILQGQVGAICGIKITIQGREYLAELMREEGRLATEGASEAHKQKTNNPADPNSRKRAKQNSNGEIPPSNSEKFGFIIRDAILVGAFGIFAAIFFSADFKTHFIIGLWCSFICLAGFFHVPAHYISKAKPQKAVFIWAIYWILLFLMVLWFSIWSSRIYSSLNVGGAAALF